MLPQPAWVAACGAPAAPDPISGALPTAIIALSPLSYWTLRGNDVFTLNDFGSLGHDLASNGIMNLGTHAGSDGFNYPMPTSTGGYLDAVDDIAYEPQNASGLTVFRLIKSPPGGTGAQVPHEMGKFIASGAGSWRMNYTNSPAALAITHTTITSSAGNARRFRHSEYTADTWQIIITRFSGSATTHPSARRDGSNLAGTQDGSGSGWNNSTQTVKFFGHDGGTGRFLGSLAHIAIFAGELSDGQCATLEAAAATDGW